MLKKNRPNKYDKILIKKGKKENEEYRKMLDRAFRLMPNIELRAEEIKKVIPNLDPIKNLTDQRVIMPFEDEAGNPIFTLGSEGINIVCQWRIERLTRWLIWLTFIIGIFSVLTLYISIFH